MAQQAGVSDMDYCSSGFHHLDRVAKPRALGLKAKAAKCRNEARASYCSFSCLFARSPRAFGIIGANATAWTPAQLPVLKATSETRPASRGRPIGSGFAGLENGRHQTSAEHPPWLLTKSAPGGSLVWRNERDGKCFRIIGVF